MLSTSERKKIKKSIVPSFGSDIKKYDELYQQFCAEGYSKELCDAYAETFVDNCKKPAADDIVRTARLYRKIHDYKGAEFYLDMLEDKKLGSDDRFLYCLEMLRTTSALGRWRDAEDFRTENINFMQTYMDKKHMLKENVNMYIALALADCAAKRYADAFRLLNFGYKPKGKNDVKLLDIFTTAVYLYAASGDEEGLAGAVNNAQACLKLFDSFEFPWKKAYYEKRIEDAANGII